MVQQLRQLLALKVLPSGTPSTPRPTNQAVSPPFARNAALVASAPLPMGRKPKPCSQRSSGRIPLRQHWTSQCGVSHRHAQQSRRLATGSLHTSRERRNPSKSLGLPPCPRAEQSSNAQVEGALRALSSPPFAAVLQNRVLARRRGAQAHEEAELYGRTYLGLSTHEGVVACTSVTRWCNAEVRT